MIIKLSLVCMFAYLYLRIIQLHMTITIVFSEKRAT